MDPVMGRKEQRECSPSSERLVRIQFSPFNSTLHIWNTNRKHGKAFPDLTFRAYGSPMIAEGDYVAAQWIGGGTHTGVAFDDLVVGKLAEPNTGKKIHFSGMTIFTLKDGKITREIAEEGGLTVLQQLGLIPQPNPGKEIKYDADGDQIYT
jgi:predicted ester cyclase